jgi:hypothetical protein
LYTDNDPNLHATARLRRSRIYRILKSIYHRLCSQKEKRLASVERELREMAEYHHFHTPGLDPDALRAQLAEIGFEDAEVVPHGNTSSFAKNSFRNCRWQFRAAMALEAVLVGTLDYSTLAPQILILARKAKS